MNELWPAGPAVVLAMIGVSVWGWRAVPRDARFRIRFGGLGFESSLGKTTSLVLWPLMGACVHAGASVAAEDADGQLIVVALLSLAILLLAQVTSVRGAARS